MNRSASRHSKPAWLRQKRRLADSNRWKRHKAANAKTPAYPGFFRGLVAPASDFVTAAAGDLVTPLPTKEAAA